MVAAAAARTKNKSIVEMQVLRGPPEKPAQDVGSTKKMVCLNAANVERFLIYTQAWNLPFILP